MILRGSKLVHPVSNPVRLFLLTVTLTHVSGIRNGQTVKLYHVCNSQLFQRPFQFTACLIRLKHNGTDDVDDLIVRRPEHQKCHSQVG